MEEITRIYGSKARIGLIVPGPNTVSETEFWRLAPDGVTIHTARLPFDHSSSDPLTEMEEHLEGAAVSLKAAGCDLIVFSCGASSARETEDPPMARIAAMAELPVVDASNALARELKRAGVQRVGLITPYRQSSHDDVRSFIERKGFEVTAESRAIVDEAQERSEGMRRVPPDMLIEAALPMAPDVDGYALSCTDMPTLAAALEIETRTGKPAISMTLAMWREASRALML
ncbi:MAG: maleate cis-trans isomerase family protein [Alphaproteobacteria bacterium]